MFTLELFIKELNKKTWKESKTKTKEICHGSMIITKLDNDFQMISVENERKQSGNYRKVARMKKINEGFELKSEQTRVMSYSDDFWLVINKNSRHTYKLSEGDTIRVFSNLLIVKKISGFSDTCVTNFEKSVLDDSCSCKTKNKQRASITSNPDILTTNEMFCRICLESTDSSEDPLINPCKCSGSMGSVHLNCFDQWLDSKFEIEKNEFYSVVKWETIYCESCKFRICEIYNFYGTVFNIFSRFACSSKFIMLMKPPNSNNTKNCLFVVDCERLSQVFIGKNGEISKDSKKNYCKILINESELIMENKSNSLSFAVLVNKSAFLSIGSKHKFINGSSIFDVAVSKTFQWKSLLCACFKSRTN